MIQRLFQTQTRKCGHSFTNNSGLYKEQIYCASHEQAWKAYHHSMCKYHLLHLIWDRKLVRKNTNSCILILSLDKISLNKSKRSTTCKNEKTWYEQHKIFCFLQVNSAGQRHAVVEVHTHTRACRQGFCGCKHHCLYSMIWYFVTTNNIWVSVVEHNRHEPLWTHQVEFTL